MESNMAELFGRTCKREIRKTDLSLPENGAEKRFRKCEKSGCPADRPECFSNATEGFVVLYCFFCVIIKYCTKISSV